MDMEGEDGADHGVCEAISAAVRAGLYRAAARANPRGASVWNTLAEPYSQMATVSLTEAIFRLGADCAGPDARGE